MKTPRSIESVPFLQSQAATRLRYLVNELGNVRATVIGALGDRYGDTCPPTIWGACLPPVFATGHWRNLQRLVNDLENGTATVSDYNLLMSELDKWWEFFEALLVASEHPPMPPKVVRSWLSPHTEAMIERAKAARPSRVDFSNQEDNT